MRRVRYQSCCSCPSRSNWKAVLPPRSWLGDAYWRTTARPLVKVGRDEDLHSSAKKQLEDSYVMTNCAITAAASEKMDAGKEIKGVQELRFPDFSGGGP